MKRLAVMAAVSHFNGYANHNLTTLMTTTTQTTITATPLATAPAPATAGATTMSFVANAAYHHQNFGNSSSPQIGGLGLLHQQYLRSASSATSGIGGFTVGGIVGGAAAAPGMSIGNGATGASNSGGSNNINGNVNVLLGGAMLSVVTTVLCVVCYCCHRSIKKRTEAAYRQRWMDNDANMEIYSVEQCYETSGLFMESSEGLAVPALSHEPPPSYDAVVAMQEENCTSRISPPPDYRSMNDVSGSSNTNEMPKFIRGSNLLGMKKVLSAQSCCSLQRAEAENLFQLGVAAAAATSGRFGASALGRKSLPYTNTIRDAAGTGVGEARFNNQPYYRGCPLCGKFRYDDSMSLSSDSGLDQVVVAVDVCNGNTTTVGVDRDTCYCTPLQSPTIDARNNNVECDRRRESVPRVIEDHIGMSSSSSDAIEERSENIINNNNGEETDTPTIDAASTSLASGNVTATTSNATGCAVTPNSGNCGTADVALNLDSINDNGIIRLDMSKIIDKTGLPTYEAALKLESSGYV